jgi:predicted TIM-barrel fold metal-dependent hydrolase
MTKMIPHKFMFGTDYPMLTPRRWLDDFNALDVNSDVRRLILSDNARKLLKIQ